MIFLTLFQPCFWQVAYLTLNILSFKQNQSYSMLPKQQKIKKNVDIVNKSKNSLKYDLKTISLFVTQFLARIQHCHNKTQFEMAAVDNGHLHVK